MADIVSFRAKTSSTRVHSSRNSRGAPPAIDDGCVRSAADVVAKEEIRKTIILLDLALQHAWEISQQIADPAVREVFDRHVAAIAQSLQIARDRIIES